ncbi:hypothetical protein niasHT_033357 [Heterodera trifolii]|uniref:Uncharacterized protein n=1 Tax=Heterodera trifolii TaxID=157864 RepID=A0ABD2IEX1_9BILA
MYKKHLIWTPEPTQQCSFIWLANWIGEYSSLIWTAKAGDFALSFENVSSHSQPECYPHPGELIVSDQPFAVQAWEYREMIEKATEQEVMLEIGPVYSSQLAAQLTALSAKMAQTTKGFLCRQ